MVLLIILICVVIVFLLLPSKGKIGEKKVSLDLRFWLFFGDYRVIEDVTLPSPYGTTQIDQIVVSTHGIFVIETKTYHGLIVGSEDAENWQQYLGSKKYEFRNPIRQNYGHIKTLERLLNVPSSCFIPIVCFSNDAKLRLSVNSTVVRRRFLLFKILFVRETIFKRQSVAEFANIIREASIKGFGTNRAHVRNVKHIVAERSEKINRGVCPRCGGTLIFRKGRYGNFWGCSNYPSCKFTLPE